MEHLEKMYLAPKAKNKKWYLTMFRYSSDTKGRCDCAHLKN